MIFFIWVARKGFLVPGEWCSYSIYQLGLTGLCLPAKAFCQLAIASCKFVATLAIFLIIDTLEIQPPLWRYSCELNTKQA